MIWELRCYVIAPGRLSDAHKRFEIDLPELLMRHGISVVGRWSVLCGASGAQFAYLMAYPDLAARDTQWANFYGDPQWPIIRARSNNGSDIVETTETIFLKSHQNWQPTLKSIGVGGVHELIMGEITIGRGPEAFAYLYSDHFPTIEAQGGHLLMVGEVMTGAKLPKFALMIAWPSAEHWLQASKNRCTNATVSDELRRQRETFGTPLLGQEDRIMMLPAPHAVAMPDLGWRGTQATNALIADQPD